MNSREMIFVNQFDSFLLGKLLDLLEFIVAEFIDSLSDVGLNSILLHEQLLNLKPLIVFEDDHGNEILFCSG